MSNIAMFPLMIASPLRYGPPVTAKSTAAALEAQHTGRLEAIADNRKAAAAEMYRQQRHEAGIGGRAVADAILESEGKERGTLPRFWHDLPNHEQHALLKDAVMPLRARRPVWQRLTRYKTRKAIQDQLTEHLSHKLSKEDIAYVSQFMCGPVLAAALGTLQGSIKVTPTEFAAATLDLLDKKAG